MVRSLRKGTRKETGDRDQDEGEQWDQTRNNVPKGTVADIYNIYIYT